MHLPKEQLCWSELGDGYAMSNLGSIYGGIKQRWQLIFSEQAFKREQRTLARKIAAERERLDNQLWHAKSKTYTCAKDAEKAAAALSKGLRYHKVVHVIEEIKKYSRSGKPKTGEIPQIVGYKINGKSERDSENISIKEATLGRFILATNELDYERLPDEAILAEYKQQSQVEGGFRFIKDPCFQVSSVFLKSPHRIEALMMIMTLCLMVYNMAQFYLRRALKASNDTVPNQSGKPIQNPTSRWIFRMMIDIAVVQIKLRGSLVKESITNVTDTIKKVVRHFGRHAMKIYDVAPLVQSTALG
jgi:transposase